MNKEKYTSPDYQPDENTSSEIELLNKQKENLSNLNLKEAQLKNIYLVDALMKNCDLSRTNLQNARIIVKNVCYVPPLSIHEPSGKVCY